MRCFASHAVIDPGVDNKLPDGYAFTVMEYAGDTCLWKSSQAS